MEASTSSRAKETHWNVRCRLNERTYVREPMTSHHQQPPRGRAPSVTQPAGASLTMAVPNGLECSRKQAMAELRRKNTSPFGRFSCKQPQAPPICFWAARVPVTCKSSADHKWPPRRRTRHPRVPVRAVFKSPHVPSAAAKAIDRATIGYITCMCHYRSPIE